VGEFVVGLWGVSVCVVWESLFWVCGECVFLLCVGGIGVGFRRVSVCCARESLMWVYGSECVLCVGEFGLGL